MPAKEARAQAVGAPTEIPELLTVPETAKLLRLSVGTIRAWVLNKKIPYCKFGGRVRFHRCDLDEFIQRNTVPARAGA
jgi:excisionase family DNA binding protein